MRVAFHTLGCKVNQFETGALERLLSARGHTVVPWETEADAYVINTCTVTAVSDKKSRQAIRGVMREHPGAVIAACGCLGQSDPQAMAALGLDLVCGTGDRQGFVNSLEEAVEWRVEREKWRVVTAQSPAVYSPLPTLHFSRSTLHFPLSTHFERLPAGSLSGRTRALLKVQDGCDNYCTYCIIPSVRGPVRSLPPDEAAAEAARLGGEGYREIVITGIEISSYGKDFPDGVTLAGLTEAICRAAPDVRIRLGSLEPRIVTGAFAARLSGLSNLCPHFHLSLQSGCDGTLRRMGRRYDTARYAQALDLLRAAFPDCAVTTDLIVGFPGETEEEFVQTLGFVERCAFAGMHIFPYSRRAGTPAASMPEQVMRAEKRDRAARASALAQRMTRAYDAVCVGKVFRVLFEEDAGGDAHGHAENYRPVRCPGADGGLPHGQVRSVKVIGVEDGGLVGVISED